jgi:hypothetical protein
MGGLLSGLRREVALGFLLLLVFLFQLLLERVELAGEEVADILEVAFRGGAEAGGLDGDAEETGGVDGEAGEVWLLVEEADEDDAEDADLGLQSGVGGGGAEGAALAKAEDGVVVAGGEALAEEGEDAALVGGRAKVFCLVGRMVSGGAVRVHGPPS